MPKTVVLVIEKSSGTRQAFLNYWIILYQKDDVLSYDQKRSFNVSGVSWQKVELAISLYPVLNKKKKKG